MDVAMQRVLFSGATLAHIVQGCKAAAGDCDGLLFGHIQRQIIPSLQDEEGPSTREEVSATVTGHFTSGRVMSFYDALGAIDRVKLGNMIGEREARGADSLIGWYVSRRNCSMRPSMREAAVAAHLTRLPASKGGSVGEVGDNGAFSVSVGSPSSSADASGSLVTWGGGSLAKGIGSENVQAKASPILPSPPCIFLLLCESETDNMVLTHDYRAFQYQRKPQGIGCFESRAISIVNIGPVFRGHYDSFAPFAAFPSLPGFVPQTDEEAGGAKVGVGDDDKTGQALLDAYAEGFSMANLVKLVRPERLGCSTELEDLYIKMLAKLDVVAKQVQVSSAALAEQEKVRARLRAESELF